MRKSPRILACVLLGSVCIGLCAPGCDDKGPGNVAVPQAANEDVARRAAAQPVGPPPPTDEQCRVFAASMEKAVASGDAATVNALIDWHGMFSRAIEEVDVQVTLRMQFIDGAKKGAEGSGGFTDAMIAEVRKGGKFRLLRLHTVGKEKRALFRLLLAPQGVNYVDMILMSWMSWPDATAKAGDMYIFSRGELHSEGLRREYLPLVQQASRGRLATLTGNQSDYIKSHLQIQEMATCIRNSQPQRAMEIYGRLPESVQKDKSVLLLRIKAAQGVGPADYLAAIKAMESAYPNDPCTVLFSIDAFPLQRRRADAIRAIDRLDEVVGGDPYLNVLRAMRYVEINDYPKARAAAQKTIDAEPTLIVGYTASVAISLASKDFKETNRLFALIEKQLGEKIGDLTSVPMYAEYVKSPEYQQWLKTHGQSTPEHPKTGDKGPTQKQLP
jgi:hypothetical protein